jgi:anti-anti-sigma regulatory factor
METPRILSSRVFPASRSAAARPRMAARSERVTSLASGQIVCLRLTGQLCAETADALLDAVGTRVRAAMPPAGTVVLDLSDTPSLDEGARAALLSLGDLLAQSQARLRLVMAEAEARTALSGDSAGNTIGPDALHTSVRAAMLAAQAALPGPALVTPALRTLLRQPPELLLLAPAAASPERHEPALGASYPANSRRQAGRLASGPR